jgi:Tfp pilus assembly protein PilF
VRLLIGLLRAELPSGEVDPLWEEAHSLAEAHGLLAEQAHLLAWRCSRMRPKESAEDNLARADLALQLARRSGDQAAIGLAWASQALSLAFQRRDPTTPAPQSTLLSARSMRLWAEARLAERRHEHRRAATIFRGLAELMSRTGREKDAVIARIGQAGSWIEAGEYERALELTLHGADDAEALGAHGLAALARVASASSALETGDPEHATELLARVTPEHQARIQAHAAVLSARIALDRGALDPARTHLERAAQIWPATHDRVTLQWQIAKGELHLAMGQLRDARQDAQLAGQQLREQRSAHSARLLARLTTKLRAAG